jgi:drug/metabolite transporter (DMT)-like permease
LAHLTLYLLPNRVRQWPTDRRLWWHAAVLGIFDTAVPMILIVLSLQYQSSGLTAMLIAIGPAITVLMAHFFLPDEPLTRRSAAGVALALGGAAALGLLGETGLPDVRRADPTGYFMVLVAEVCGSAMTIYTRRYVREFDTFQTTSVRVFAAALVVMPLSLPMVGFDLSRVTWQGYLALGYGAIAGAFFGMLLLLHNIKRFGATSTASTLYVVPVIASLGGVLLLGEEITRGMIACMALIVVGVGILNRRRPSAIGAL